MERINVNYITVEQFQERYEMGSKPVIIEEASEGWSAHHQWTLKNLLAKFADSLFKVGETEKGQYLKLTLKEFVEYLVYNRDDSPLYVFEMGVEAHPEAKDLMNDYKVPKFFEENIFVDMLGETDSPPHRWWLLGPQRSGSIIHQDPLSTSAWNTSISGRKRWLLIKPEEHVTKWNVKGIDFTGNYEEKTSAIKWFDQVVPKMKVAHGPEGDNTLQFFECV